MDADGSNQQRLTHDGPNGVQNTSAEIFDSDPVWSPDGNEIGRRRVHPPRGRFACADRHRRGAGLVAGRLADRVLGAGRHLDDRPGRSESGACDRHSTGLQSGLVARRLDDRLRRDAVLALPTERLGADLVA
jgi:hypothetical protein